MDLHPAPIPVTKRRVSVKPTLKSAMAGTNAKKDKLTPPLVPAKPRPKRAFGVNRNTNIPVERQLKQHKPTGPTANLAKRIGTTTENAKLTPTERKKQLQKIHLKENKEKQKEEATQTSATANLTKGTVTPRENAKLTPTERKKQLQKIHLREDKERRKEEATQTSATANLTKGTVTPTENDKLNPTERKKHLQNIHLKEDKDKKKEEATQTSATANLTKRTETPTENAKLTPTEMKKQLQKINLKEDKGKKNEEANQTTAKRTETPAENAKVIPNERKQLQKIHLKEDKEKHTEEATQTIATANLTKRTVAPKENDKLTSTERKKQLPKLHSKEDKEKKKEEAMQTPLAVTKQVMEDGTPYLSALNCSKCRHDRLETSSYWLNQIKLSEAVGKHFVSAAFFRLALECHAQPFEKILSELKHYLKRHQNAISCFDGLLQSYGLPVEKTKTEYAGILISEPNKTPFLFDSHNDEPEETTVSSEGRIEMFTSEEEHDCSSNQETCPDISQEQPDNEPVQGEIVKPEHCEVENQIGEVNSKLKSDVLEDHYNSAFDKGAGKNFNESPPTRDALSSEMLTTCLENSSLTKKAVTSANEVRKSKGKEAVVNRQTECIRKINDEVVSMTDSLESKQGINTALELLGK